MLTREQFQLIYEQGPDAVYDLLAVLYATASAQQQQITLLQAEVKELRERLNKDSHNSSKPPSSDGLAKKPVSLRQPSGRKAGGQPGHKGCTLALVDTPDTTEVHMPACCAACQADLTDAPATLGERRQVHDLPPLRLFVTEHQVQRKTCAACGYVTQGAFPPQVSQPVQYGAGVQVYLSAYQLLPFARTSELLRDLFGAGLCPATLLACQQRAGAALHTAHQQIAQALCQSLLVHYDESGLRVAGKLHWLHLASTSTLTHYTVHPKRGKAGLDAAGILPHFTGIALHDGWKAYQAYVCRHALCNAHHLRELTALYEADPHQQAWAHALQTLLRDGKRAVECAQSKGQQGVDACELAVLSARYERLVQQGYAANPPPELPSLPRKRGRVAQSTARNLLNRLHTFQAETLRFLSDFRVPFDNNLAERDIRMIKVQQKISNGFRTLEGAEAFCCVRSYISTLRKQGRHVLTALQQVFAGNVPCPLPLPE